MNKKPIIGIIGKVSPNFNEDLWHRNRVADEFRYYVVKNGGIAISILPTEKTMIFNDNDIFDNTNLTEEELEDLYMQIELCDGFILQGGLISCNYEIELAKKIIELDKPLIGVCAGFNNILRALDTDVVEDKSKSHDIYEAAYRHKIKIEKDTIIYNLIHNDEYSVNSIHSMIAPKDLVKDFVKISSYSEDGLVESFEVQNKKFIVGIKWHPELMHDEVTDNIFKAFIDKCRE